MERVLYYSSETSDDFAANGIEHKDLPPSYRFAFKNPIARAAAFFLYYLFGIPFGFLFQKIVFHEKIVGRKKLKPYRKTGYFLYGNHTRTAGDAYCPGAVAFPKKAYIIANADCMNIPGMRFMVKAFGAIPIPLSVGKMKEFVRAVETFEQEGRVITIYPEAHIWPYYTKIRPFSSVSFRYPAESGKPVFTFTTVYKKRKFGKRPKTVVYVDGPFFPKESSTVSEKKQELRDLCFEAMTARAALSDCEYVRYEKKPDAPENPEV